MRIVLYGILVLLLAGDVASTSMALRLGAEEGNPLVAGISESSILHLTLKLGFAGVVFALARQSDRFIEGSGTYCIAAACMVYCLPLINNVLWIHAALGAM
ncbi:MAG: hypothetical protein KO206_07205 [Methanomicrobiaceae archaeon]|nr:hypothetical protein [Methanomicrobiaceae archaeon]